VAVQDEDDEDDSGDDPDDNSLGSDLDDRFRVLFLSLVIRTKMTKSKSAST
jgi:hypothetical protein